MEQQIYNYPEHALQILANVNTKGELTWTSPYRLDDYDKILAFSPNELARHMFCISKITLNKDEFWTDSFVRRLNMSVEPDPSKPNYLKFKAQAAILFGLPNKNPVAELQEVANFLLKIKDIFSDFYKTFPDYEDNLMLHFTNMKGKSGSGFDFITRDMTKEQTQYLTDKNQVLEQYVLTHENVQKWVKCQFSMLKKLGPHSWSTYTPDDFFSAQDNPFMIRFRENYKKEEQAKFAKKIEVQDNMSKKVKTNPQKVKIKR